MYQGVLRILIGLAKKLVVADTLALTGAELESVQTPGHAWTVVLAYGFRILFDFSAYSDLAIGFARLLGIRVPENFNYPVSRLEHPGVLESLAHHAVALGTRLRVRADRTPVVLHAAASVSGGHRRRQLSGHVSRGRRLAWPDRGASWCGACITVRLLAGTSRDSGADAADDCGEPWYRSWVGHVVGGAITFLCVTIGWVPFMTDLPRARTLLTADVAGSRLMRAWLIDLAVGAGIAVVVVILMLFASFNSTFIYRGF